MCVMCVRRAPPQHEGAEILLAVDLVPGYRELPPPSTVREVVDCLWVRVTQAGDEVRVLPDASADIVWRQGVGTTLVGPDTSAKLLTYDESAVVVGMRLRPGAAGSVVGVPLEQVRDLRVDVAEINRRFDLDAELAPTHVISSFVAAAAERQGDPLVTEAVRRLARDDVRAVAGDLAISERQLLRRFQASVGYGPKTLARVLRFRRFLDAVDSGKTNLARLALDAGYADQAHLTRETTRLAGMTPQALIRSRSHS
ncbi:MAG TPA: AraC family transcriptional regulator [Thermoleophilaceae bacterium]|nr:AraC family transcriptional regulator [Thermoleophilaceae bacterium]